ncbi:unnamed protein product [Knipowitschia caucasica]
MASVLRGSWRLLAPPLLRVAPPSVWKTPLQVMVRRHASKQVKSHRKEPKLKTEKQEVEIKQRMSVEELARAMGRDVDHVLDCLMDSEVNVDRVRPSSILNDTCVKHVVQRSGMKFVWTKLSETREKVNKDATCRAPDPALLRPRPPVVTIMGHVDHGKTTLLDSLRMSQITATEAGGITQHIGAFTVRLASGETMTVLDTPGHAAFSSIRARGASITDIVILVVAADDGVMEQTVESIRHARNAGVPMIVAVNKCDKVQADPERVKRELLSHDVVCEEFGGDIQAVHVSALKGEGLVELTEAVVALAEVLELKAEHEGAMEGAVIESRTDKGKGPVSTALVQRGALQRGAVLVSGRTWAKVRFMFDESGSTLDRAEPSQAVQICGWRELPSAGESILEVETEQRAREVLSYRLYLDDQQRQSEEQKTVSANQEAHQTQYRLQRAELAHLSWRQRKNALYQKNKEVFNTRAKERDSEEGSPRLGIIIKGDVDGSVETLLNVLDSYDAQDQCELNLIHFGTGDVSETDVNLAHTFSGSVYGFNVSVPRPVQQMALKKGVPIKLQSVIYKLIEELKEELSQKLPSETTENVLGSLSALKHHKDDVSSVKLGSDCGLSADGDVDFSPGDIVQCFEEVQTPQTCDWTPPGF